MALIFHMEYQVMLLSSSLLPLLIYSAVLHTILLHLLIHLKAASRSRIVSCFPTVSYIVFEIL